METISQRPMGTHGSPTPTRPIEGPSVEQRVDATFRRHDRNRDGVINLRREGDDPTSKQAGPAALLVAADRNGNGRVTRQELRRYLTIQELADAAGEVQRRRS